MSELRSWIITFSSIYAGLFQSHSDCFQFYPDYYGKFVLYWNRLQEGNSTENVQYLKYLYDGVSNG